MSKRNLVKKGLPKGSAMPAILQSFYWLFYPCHFMNKYSKRYGDSFTCRFRENTVHTNVFFSHPKALEEILTASPEQVTTHQNEVLRLFLGDNALILLNGQRHLRARQMMNPAFHGQRIRLYGMQIQKETEQIIAQWPINKPFHILPFLHQISVGIIIRMVLGIQEEDKYQLAKQRINSLMHFMRNPKNLILIAIPFLQKNLGPLTPWNSYLKIKKEIDELIYNEINFRRKQPGNDILSTLLSAQDEGGSFMQDEEIRDQILILLLAGHETTGNALAWAFYWIHRTPGIIEKLTHELKTNIQDGISEKAAHLPYLDAVCKEVLRISSVSPMLSARYVQSPITIMGHELPKGTMVSPCIYLTHQREDIYPQPNLFRPERFLEKKFSPYEFIPFGGGVHRCIGGSLALYEMKLILATVLSHCKLEIIGNKPIKPVRSFISLVPNNNFQLKLIARI